MKSTDMFLMEQTMRWYGPQDPVSLSDIRQAGCTGVVTALHQIPVGEVWTVEEITSRRQTIEESGLSWSVVESLPVSEDIKTKSGNYQKHIENYKLSIRNLASCGIPVVAYNFMPVLDWVRTNPHFLRPDGSRTLRFVKTDFILFDLFLLKRKDVQADYNDHEVALAKSKYESMNEAQKKELFDNLLLGLPGSDDAFTGEQVLSALETYAAIDRSQLKEHLFYFLKEVVPIAETCGVRLAIHPDDPPWSVLGLPRIVSNEADLREIIDCCPSPANGLCFCTGSLGVNPENELVGMLNRFNENIHFLHLRNVKRDDRGNFEEAEHLEGDVDMVGVMKEVLAMMQRRGEQLPMRPDHGFQMMDDLAKSTYPGYSAIGRMKGLAELRGLELGLASTIK